MTNVSITPAVQQFLQRRHGSFIAGRAVHDESGAAIEVINPATGEALAAFTGASPALVEEAVASAGRRSKAAGRKPRPISVACCSTAWPT